MGYEKAWVTDMMGDIFNTLRYGNKKTKGLLYLLFVLAVLSIVFFLSALSFQSPMLAIAAAVFFLIAVGILFHARFSKEAIGKENNAGKTKKTKAAKQGNKTKKQKNADEKQKNADERQKDAAEKQKNAAERQKNKAITQENGGTKEYMALEWIPSQEQEPAAVQYDEATLKKVMVAYKVRKEHVPIMIEYCQKEQINQCPAYLWKDRTFLYFLLLEEVPRMIKCPITDVDGIHIRRGVPARPSAEYQHLQESKIVSRVFSPYLPNYYRAEAEGRRVEHRKNMYALAPGVWCTAASVKNMLSIMACEFYVEEEKINSDQYSSYFRKIYIDRILYRDMVMTAAEYNGKVQDTLTALATAELSEDTFHVYLAQMVMGALIPQEYADFAVARREKRNKK